MKSFSTFITEAKKTTAGQQAEKLGLSHVGWGKYADKSGRVTHFAQQGVLRPVAVKEPAAPAQAQQEAPPSEPEQQVDQPLDKGPVTITFGRFNPPHLGHLKLVDKVAEVAGDTEYRIYPSRSHDEKKNPLDPETKVHYMHHVMGDHSHAIVNDDNMRNIFQVLAGLHEEGYSSVNIVVGGDRVSEFEKLSNKYNGKLYNFEGITVQSAGDRDPDSEDEIEGMSASKMRAAAAADDVETFMKGLPEGMDKKQAIEMMAHVKGYMKVEEDFAMISTPMHEIAPKLDPEGLREAYFNGDIFAIGALVENLNTGVVGKVVTRGANYVIYVDENDEMYRGWLKDLVEINDLKAFNWTPMGEIGTDKLRDRVIAMTPGQFLKKINKKDKDAQ